MQRFGALFAAATDASEDAQPLAAGSVIVAGMGGSGIAGRLAQALAERCGGLRVSAWSDYGLPAWADGSERLIAVSYSGNTAETLSGVERAIELGCGWEAITTGGRLAALGREYGAPVTAIEPGHQPRAALPLLLPLPHALLSAASARASGAVRAKRKVLVMKILVSMLGRLCRGMSPRKGAIVRIHRAFPRKTG